MVDKVYLVRHAAPPEANQGRYWGAADPGIDPGSLSEAARLAALFEERPMHFWSSPTRRAWETADVLGAGLGVAPRAVADLAEIDFGFFDGMTYAECVEHYPKAAREWRDNPETFGFPGGESVPAFEQRVERAWRECAALDSGTAVVVAHGGVLSSWLCLFLGLPQAKRLIFRPACARLTLLVRRGETWEMAYFNRKA